MSTYSNARALRALVTASLQSILRSPSALVFGIAFPLVFILVFGFIGGSGSFNVRVAGAPGGDTTNDLYRSLRSTPALKWNDYKDSAALGKALSAGDITATIRIQEQPEGTSPRYKILILAASSRMDKVPQLQAILQQAVQRQDPEINIRTEQLATIDVIQQAVRPYRTIDFILPGQLGFSLLAGSVFGTAFVFFNLRQTLVLKRFFATPVRREIIVLSEGIARLIFQLLTSVIVISVGHFAFGFTLIHGFGTFVALLGLSTLATMVFMGFGFVISGIAKSEATIPPLSNLVTLPQFLLAGTFFSVEAFPKWLQPVTKAMPLTYLNDAMRKVAFDGAGLWELRWDILPLLLWGLIVYVAAGRLFKWE
jgi:ABC-2 type transport system permease protein